MRTEFNRKVEFNSAKCVGSVPVRHPLIGDALVFATLDPFVQAIECVPIVNVRGTDVALDGIVITDRGGRRLLDVSEVAPIRDLDEQGLVLLAREQLNLPEVTMTAADIVGEPCASNSKIAWACRHQRVTASDRVRVLASLAEEGRMSLVRAAAEVRQATDPVGAVLALACLDLLELDLVSQPLGAETPVRRRNP